jgi:quercetin dioxygenase-like cupin family protein
MENMTNEPNPVDGVLRRTVVKASAVAAGTFGMIGSASATSDDDEENDNDDDVDIDDEYGDEDEDDNDVDEPEGFTADVLAPHGGFLDDVATRLTLEFADEHEGDPIEVDLDDTSNIVFLELNWEPEGTIGWHRHPGPVMVNVVEGELEVVWERDCVPRTYTAGDAFLDPGEVHIASNPSDTDCTQAFALALGVPDDDPVTEWVEPVDC